VWRGDTLIEFKNNATKNLNGRMESSDREKYGVECEESVVFRSSGEFRDRLYEEE
jgi:hypothetical protein